MIIARETIDEILQKVNIVDLVSQYAEVKHKGSTYVACCPFHNEKTPSFHISPEKGVYHCFGCGESGNIFSFLMKMGGLSFVDAVAEIANKFNIEIKYTNTKFQDNKKDIDALYKVNVLSYKYFEYSLKANYDLIKDYLNSRKITTDSIKDFYIGFAPNEWHGLYNFLKKSKVPESVMELSGLFYRNQSGNLYDVFRGRLMFPVITEPKKISGFGGRVIPGILSKEDIDNQPKYLNSKETLVYEKSKILYNFFNARDEIKRKKFLFLVEGYMDVVGLARVNVKNVIATCGTALTQEHAKKIENLNVQVIVMFDADTAGYNAAAKAFLIFLNTKINAEALFLPNGEDPDSLSDKEGLNTLNFLKNLPRISLLDAYFRKLLRDENIEHISQASANTKQKISDIMLEAISKINSNIKKLEIIKEASFLLQVPVGVLNKEIQKFRGNVVNFPEKNNDLNNAGSKTQIINISKLPSIDREVLGIVLKDTSYIDVILKNSDLCQYLTNIIIDFVLAYKNFLQQNLVKEHNNGYTGLDNELSDFLNSFGNDFEHLFKSLNGDKSNFNPSGAYEQCVNLAKRLQKEELIKNLENELQLTKDETIRIELINKLFEIKKNFNI